MFALKIDVDEIATDSASKDAPLKGRILCVDDDAQILMSLQSMFWRLGHKAQIAKSAGEGLEWLANYEVDVVISDRQCP